MTDKADEVPVPDTLAKAHVAFDHATTQGQYLWPSQREAYCAGYWTAYDAALERVRELEKALGKIADPKPVAIHGTKSGDIEEYADPKQVAKAALAQPANKESPDDK